MDFDQKMGNGFVGIIGHEFLRKNKLVLDYETETLHTSTGVIHENPGDYAFFFPMLYGIKKYNVPVVGLVYGDKEYVMVADSGSDYTVITQHMVEEAGIDKQQLDVEKTVTGFTNGPISSSVREVSLSLLSIGNNDESPKLFLQDDIAQVINNCDYIMEGFKNSEGNDILPVSGLLSSEFMLKNKWILDFETGIIYQNKENKHV